MPPRAFWLLLAAAALAMAGIALGVSQQEESFLAPTPDAPLAAGSPVVGNAIALTSLVVAGGAILVAWLLPPKALRLHLGIRIAYAALLAIGLFVVVNLLQTAWPNYFVCNQNPTSTHPACHQAVLRIQLILHNEPTVAALLVPLMAILVAGLLACATAVRGLLGRKPPVPGPGEALRRQIGLSCVAVPFLAITAWSNLRLLTQIPAGGSGTAFLVLLPGLSALALALITLQGLKLLALARLDRDSRFHLAVEDAWAPLGRVETILAAAFVVLAVAGGFLRGPSIPALLAPLTYHATLPAYTAGLAFAMVPLAPHLAFGRTVQRALLTPPTPGAGHANAMRIGVLALALLGLATVLCGIFTVTSADPLPVWLAALMPAGILALRWGAAVEGSLTLVCGAAVAWALGNATFAHFTGVQDNFLAYDSNPGVQALWRLVGAAWAGVAATRLARQAATPRSVRSVLWATGFGATIAAALFIELPLGAWVNADAQGSSLAVGSLLNSLDAPVRIVAHTLAIGLATACAFCLAKLVRPEWFQRGRHPWEVPAARAAPTPRPRPGPPAARP